MLLECEQIETNRYILRNIDPNYDDFQNYISWMRDTESNQFILSATNNFQIEDLRNYVLQKNNAENALLVGIFDKQKLNHIGNIKFEPILKGKSACLGILIGEPDYRGIGTGRECLEILLEYGFTKFNLDFIYLGVDLNNHDAKKLYKKLGFVELQKTVNISDGIEMQLHKTKFWKRLPYFEQRF